MAGIIVHMEKLTEFKGKRVSFIETMHVKEGVDCDVYSFVDDSSKDLGVITVRSGQMTPLQRVVLGTRTIEGYVSGRGTLTVGTEKGETKVYLFDEKNAECEINVEIGQIMQWAAAQDSNLVFYEICEPPYQDGRFENLD